MARMSFDIRAADCKRKDDEVNLLAAEAKSLAAVVLGLCDATLGERVTVHRVRRNIHRYGPFRTVTPSSLDAGGVT